MRHAVILAGGTGTRLWPMSRRARPKQLIPFLRGRSLLELAVERLAGLVGEECRYVCAGREHRAAIAEALAGWPERQFIGEPEGRDTLNAIGLCASLIEQRDPGAVMAVLTADQLIEPVDAFQQMVSRAFSLAEKYQELLLTFGITPTGAATAYGYLELGDAFDGEARVVRRFVEKPAVAIAAEYFAAGPDRYLWNSGMFVWRARTFLECVARYEPATAEALSRMAAGGQEAIDALFPTLRKVSVDYAVMEPASRDPRVRVAAIPMTLRWLDVGSWPMFAETCPAGDDGNSLAATAALLDTSGTLVVSSDPKHLIAAIGCHDLVIVHTPDATLVAPRDRTEAVKQLQQMIAERFRGRYV